MKFNFKITAMIVGLFFADCLFAASTSGVDPDTSVYNALSPLCTDAAIEALDLTGAQGLMSAINSAITFYSSPDATQLASVNGFKTKVQGRIDTLNAAIASTAAAQTAAKSALTAALAATDFATLTTKLNDTNLISQFAWLKTNSATDLANLYTKINAWYKGVATQSAANLSAYLDGLKSLSNSIKANTTVFGDKSDILGYADAIIVNADAAKGVLTSVDLTTLSGVTAALSNSTYVSGAKSFRTLKAKMPTQ